MCEIYGDRRLLPEDIVEAMGDVIADRGLDHSGTFHSHAEAVSIDSERLATTDVGHGHQPFLPHDGNAVIAQNGAIFNNPELTDELTEMGFPCRTNCDTGVLLRLYRAHGIDSVSWLDGVFAVAILHRRDDCVYLYRDHVGEKPPDSSFDDERLLFGSETKSILEATDSLTFSIRFDDPLSGESKHVLEIANPDMFDNCPIAFEHRDQQHGDGPFLPMQPLATSSRSSWSRCCSIIAAGAPTKLVCRSS